MLGTSCTVRKLTRRAQAEHSAKPPTTVYTTQMPPACRHKLPKRLQRQLPKRHTIVAIHHVRHKWPHTRAIAQPAYARRNATARYSMRMHGGSGRDTRTANRYPFTHIVWGVASRQLLEHTCNQHVLLTNEVDVALFAAATHDASRWGGGCHGHRGGASGSQSQAKQGRQQADGSQSIVPLTALSSSTSSISIDDEGPVVAA